MNNNRALYGPAVVYSLLLLLVWVTSWLFGIVGLVSGWDAPVASLLSAEGVRWAVRNASVSLSLAPWGTIMLGVALCGLFMGSGMEKSIRCLRHGKALALNERRAWLFALSAAVVYLLAIAMCVVSPWRLLLGVTGNVYASPLVQGRAILGFAGVAFVLVVYGFIYGNYRSVVDVARAVGTGIAVFAPALLAVMPATGIVPCVEYAGLPALANVQDGELQLLSDVLYLLPFLFVIAMRHRALKNESGNGFLN